MSRSQTTVAQGCFSGSALAKLRVRLWQTSQARQRFEAFAGHTSSSGGGGGGGGTAPAAGGAAGAAAGGGGGAKEEKKVVEEEEEEDVDFDLFG